jgi:PhzF family phenazine biosynthesis protein
MPVIELHQVDAFTDVLFGGNPAGVVTDARELSDAQMASIAREMNLSETAFVLPASLPDADVRLRYFTPTTEVRFCGHATIGTLFQLARDSLQGLGGPGINTIRVETGVGVIEMAVDNTDGDSRVTFTAPPVALEAYRLQGEAFADEFGVPPSVIDPQATIHVDPVLRNIFVPVGSLAALGELRFDFARIRERFGFEETVIFAWYARETVDPTRDVHVRGLAPNVGVDEDPVTGSMQAGLVLAAKANGYVPEDQAEVVTEQGHFVGRPGFATIHHDAERQQLKVTASAVHVFSTTLRL